MGAKETETARGTYHAAVIRTDGTSTWWTLDDVTAEQAAGAVRKLAAAEDARGRILIATVCRAGTSTPHRVTLPPAGPETIYWAACGQYDVTAIDGRVYAVDGQGERYVDLLDGEGERYIQYDGPPKDCGMDERCQAAAAACAAHAGITGARHVFDRC